jgi:general secretion pathway protein G
MLRALGGMNPGFVYRIDFGRLFGGIADLASKFATTDKTDDFAELTMLRELPPLVMTAGVEDKTWEVEFTTDLPRFVQAVEHIEATPTPAKNKKRVKDDIIVIVSALKEYAMSNAGQYPASLDLLLTPDPSGNRYLSTKKIPLDPWGRPYLYTAPVPGNPEPRVYTLGKDGKQGGSGENADIDNVSIEEGR